MTTCFLISVYINDNYNDFVKAINSCLNQTIPPTKIIIVKDGPIKKNISNYCYKISTKHNVLLVDCAENLGLGSALNKGFNFVEEDIVIRMDSDDISRFNRVEKKIRSANISEVLVDVKLGDDFLKRRIGFKLFNSWLKVYNIMRKDGYISTKIFYRNAVIRFIQFNLLPKKFLSILYSLSRSNK